MLGEEGGGGVEEAITFGRMSAEAQQRNVKVKYQSAHESLLTSLTK